MRNIITYIKIILKANYTQNNYTQNYVLLLIYTSSSSSSSLTFNVMRTQFVKDHTLITTLRQPWTVFRCQTHLLISIMRIIEIIVELDKTDYVHATGMKTNKMAARF